MVQLTEEKIIEIMREEWAQRVLTLEKSLNTFMKTPDGEKFIIGTGTKVKHTGSGLLYTVVAVDKGRNVVCLKTPDGGEFDIDGTQFEGDKPEYELA